MWSMIKGVVIVICMVVIIFVIFNLGDTDLVSSDFDQPPHVHPHSSQ